MTKRKGSLVGIFLVGLCLAYPSFASAQQPILWGSLQQGPQNVGFRSRVAFDSSRTLDGTNGPRPIQVSMWYPAQSGSSVRRINYRSYFLLSANERSGDPLTKEQEKESVGSYKGLLAENGNASKAADDWFGSTCASEPNAPSAKGKFPVVLVAQGFFHSAHHQAVLCEFIASHGFIVLTTPSQARISGPMTSDQDVIPHAEAQAQDLLFAMNSLEENPNADIQNIGLVAHSFGARSAFLLALKDSRMKALVSLDGGIANKLGKEWIQKVSDFNPSNFKTPILHFYEDSESFIVPDFELIESLSGVSRTLIYMPGMRHIQFSSFGVASAFIPGFAPSVDRRLGARCEAVANYTVDFLLAHVKNEKEAWKRLNAALDDSGYDETILVARIINPREQ